MSTTEGQVPNSEKLSYGGDVEKRSLHDCRSSSQGHINITHIEEPGCLSECEAVGLSNAQLEDKVLCCPR